MNVTPVISRAPLISAAPPMNTEAQGGGAASADFSGRNTRGKDFAATLNNAAAKTVARKPATNKAQSDGTSGGHLPAPGNHSPPSTATVAAAAAAVPASGTSAPRGSDARPAADTASTVTGSSAGGSVIRSTSGAASGPSAGASAIAANGPSGDCAGALVTSGATSGTATISNSSPDSSPDSSAGTAISAAGSGAGFVQASGLQTDPGTAASDAAAGAAASATAATPGAAATPAAAAIRNAATSSPNANAANAKAAANTANSTNSSAATPAANVQAISAASVSAAAQDATTAGFGRGSDPSSSGDDDASTPAVAVAGQSPAVVNAAAAAVIVVPLTSLAPTASAQATLALANISSTDKHSHGEAGDSSLSDTPGDGAAGAAQLAAGPSAGPNATATPTLKVSADVGTPAFAQDVTDHLSWMVGNSLNGAKLEVNPAQLGPIEVRIAVLGNQAQVSLTAHSAATRDALEASSPKLRDMLGAQGFAQVSVDISQRSFQDRSPTTQSYDWQPPSERSASSASLTSAAVPRITSGVLDAYA
jgi:flagellar hook-length control protein FliK